MNHDTPRVYIACLASYNAGTLHGKWVDATDVDVIREGIQEVLDSSPTPDAEEYAVHDYDNFGDKFNEWPDIDELAELGTAIEEHGPAYIAYADNVGMEFASVDGFQEDYCGEYATEQEYAEELFDELHSGEVPEHIAPYIDYEAYARDLFMGDYYSIFCPSGGVYVFRSS